MPVTYENKRNAGLVKSYLGVHAGAARVWGEIGEGRPDASSYAEFALLTYAELYADALIAKGAHTTVLVEYGERLFTVTPEGWTQVAP